VKTALTLALASGLFLPVPVESSAQAGKGKEIAGWYQFRGPNRDAISPDTGLLKDWPSGGPPLLWKATGLGTGYSSVSISGNTLFTMGEAGGKSQLLALSVADGKVLWKQNVGEAGNPGNQGAGPRGTPATDGTLVFALGQCGELVCARAANGAVVWQKSLERDFGGNRPQWGWAESPLLDGNFVMVSPGSSRASVVALQKSTGAPAWQAKARGSAHYTSLAVADIGGVRQYLYFNDQCVAGIAAANGQVAWSADRSGQTAIASTPMYKDGMVFVASGYGVGHTAFRISGGGGRFQAQKAYEGKELINHHGGMVLVGDHVYGTDEAALKCMELKTGKVLWQDRCVGKGSVISADGHLIVRGEGGGIALVEASPAGYKAHGQFSVPKSGGNGAWANPVVFGGKLYIRDWETLLCYDVKGK
jgi:outer membrane protein assembly factor BamB